MARCDPRDVLVVEDCPHHKQAIVEQLTEGGLSVVAQVETGSEAIEAVARFRPGTVLLDTTLPDMGPDEATHEILEIDPNINVIWMVVSSSDPAIVEQQEVLTRLGRKQSLGGRRLELAGAQRVPRHLSLTPKQLAVLRLVGLQKRNREIAEALGISVSAAASRIRRIKEKLGIDDRLTLVLYSVRYGIVDVHESELLDGT